MSEVRGTRTPVLETRGITKVFPGVVANSDINFTLYEGEILVNGKAVRMSNPKDAIALGIGMVHQHFQLVPVMTVAENIMLGSETTRYGFLNINEVSRRIQELSQRYNLEVEPSAIVEDLPVGVRQRVEIVKALYRNAEILILDEPTAVLTPQEIDGLFEVMELLSKQGKSIIFITHKLKEVLRIADRITVLRGGKTVGEADPKTATQASLAAMMVGREVILVVEKEVAQPRDVILDVQNLSAHGDFGGMSLHDVSLDVHAGEIVGVAGVQGNGQTELVEVLTGLRPPKSGKVLIGSKDMTHAPPRRITDDGQVSHVPEDRHVYGMVDSYSVADNLVLNSYFQPPFARWINVNQTAIYAHANELIQKFDVRTPSPATSAGSLSGGNQQKMVVAREFSRPLQLLVAAQPTRGIDVGSIEFIHNQIVAKRDEGAAVLLVSSELDEIMALSDRIVVMYKGAVIDTVDRADATREGLGLLMAGVKA